VPFDDLIDFFHEADGFGDGDGRFMMVFVGAM
jgi:hypothetical protein